MGREPEFKRTCDRCNTTWFVTARDLKGPSLAERIDKGVSLSPSFRDLRKRQDALRDLDLVNGVVCLAGGIRSLVRKIAGLGAVANR
jgi:hypothetical protein